MTSTRRRARVIALQALYEFDCVGHAPGSSVSRLVQEKHLSEDVSLFAHELVAGVLENEGELDTTIKRFAPNFPVDQLSVIDKNILRLAIFEILITNKVPMKAAINEAVELAKTFGSRNSPRFVNGVLGSVSALASR